MFSIYRCLCLLALWGVAGCAAPRVPEREWILQPEIGASLISAEAGDSTSLRAFGAGGKVLHHWGRFGLGVGAEYNVFDTRTLDDKPDAVSTALLGADVSVLSAEGRIRSSTNVGFAWLVQGTELDEPGALGFFWEVRAVTYRFKVADDLALSFSPLSGLLIVPEPSGIPLVDIQYRVNFAVEFL
ncbi:MAG: hypothetical protein ACE366_08845 [Bradymonadia bacterium]